MRWCLTCLALASTFAIAGCFELPTLDEAERSECDDEVRRLAGLDVGEVEIGWGVNVINGNRRVSITYPEAIGLPSFTCTIADGKTTLVKFETLTDPLEREI